ncbi:hypothetical protein AX17_000933 [Amanita inopinata Kibby_2008]|nr:hypothetical protein AX17_000933 [Amanita inopinata Kibby_2008]
MNYLRGAVNAISAPYLYYKELPPINPSTLTGAIDVIVIQRPSKDGGTELACSPFHVRFGKWQVLRPSDKRVNVSVNGHPIPYNMKIGGAGEAFFVIETDEDVPEDLITSPILQPTHPEGEVSVDAAAGPSLNHKIQHGAAEVDMAADRRPRATSEPEFLDLNALPTVQGKTTQPAHDRPTHTPFRGSMPSVPGPEVGHIPTGHEEEDLRVDELLQKCRPGVVRSPDVEYHRDVVLDAEGYHQPDHLDRMVKNTLAFPSYADRQFSDSEHEQSASSPSPPISSSADSSESSNVTRRNSFHLHSFPSSRATSEPPPDTLSGVEDTSPSQKETAYRYLRKPPLDAQPELSSAVSCSSPSSAPLASYANYPYQQEYSWEWGAFPTPSPVKTTFPSAKGKERAYDMGSAIDSLDNTHDIGEEDIGEADNEDEAETEEPGAVDSKSWRRRRGRRRSRHEQSNINGAASLGESDTTAFDLSGQIRENDADPTQFVLDLAEGKVLFELSLVSGNDISHTTDRQQPFHELDKDRATQLFDQGKLTFQSLLDDQTIVTDPRLVIRCPGSRYITHHDNPPLMQALEKWRDTVLQRRQCADSLTVASSGRVGPAPAEEPSLIHLRSKSEPPDETHLATTGTGAENERPEVAFAKSPTLSWVHWWRRSRKGNSNMTGKDKRGGDKDGKDRLGWKGSVSAPATPPVREPLKTELVRPKPAAKLGQMTPMNHTQIVVPKRRFAKTLRLTSDQLKGLDLQPGANSITFSLSASGAIACTARIFLWDSTDLVVISDIDGTITKSDGLGHVFAMIGRDWTHLGVAKLFSDIVRNDYKIMYLTSRAIGQADATRYYLKGIKQNDYQLPEGPVIMSPDRLMASLHREVIMRKPEVFKMACLRDIRNLFGDMVRNPFYAGFGNRITDALSYRSVNVPSSRIFTIDSSGEVKMELLELAGYKSSYIHMTDLVDQMFPPMTQKWTPEYTDFNFWRTPLPDIPLPDLSPPSPALSARSDTSTKSTLAQLRSFSLGGGRKQATPQKPEATYDDLERNAYLRQMSSLERLNNTVVDGLKRSMSPDSLSESSTSFSESEVEDGDGEWKVDADGKKRKKRERRRSMESMPGSLDDMHFFGLDDYEDEDRQLGEPVFGEYERSGDGHPHGDDRHNREVHDDDIADEEALDEDLFVAGEMQNVPFL